MRLVIILLLVVVVTAWAGYAVRGKDRIATGILWAFSAVTAVVLAAAFFA